MMGGSPSRISASIGGWDAFNSFVLRYFIRTAKMAAQESQQVSERKVV